MFRWSYILVGANEVDSNLANNKERLDSAKANIVGVILNKFKTDTNMNIITTITMKTSKK
ncbi:MAG: hypothetical protein ACLT69_13185 [Intestinibacter bartlettii]